MSEVSVFSFLHSGVFIVLVIGMMFLAPVLCSIYKKGDIRVHFSRGKTNFELNAKERVSDRRKTAHL
jgi:hypothetical protein